MSKYKRNFKGIWIPADIWLASKHKRDFKGVWVPADVWLNNELSVREKIMLVEIDSLIACPERGCCEGDEHFAKLFGLSELRVSEIISSLAKKGYLRVDCQRKGERTIYLVELFSKGGEL